MGTEWKLEEWRKASIRYTRYILWREWWRDYRRWAERQRERESSTKWTITPSGVHSRHETREIYGTAGIVWHVTGTKKCETIPSPPLALPISRNSDRMVACATPDCCLLNAAFKFRERLHCVTSYGDRVNEVVVVVVVVVRFEYFFRKKKKHNVFRRRNFDLPPRLNDCIGLKLTSRFFRIIDPFK